MLHENVRHALRASAKHPGFTASVVLTLAIGIGANVAMFSVVNAVLLRPLPFENPERLVVVRQHFLERGFIAGLSYPDFVDWRAQNGILQDLAAYSPTQFDVADAGDVGRIPGAIVSANFFSLLGVSPSFGRTFTAADEAGTGGSVAVISHQLWQRRFGSERSAVGTTIALNGRVHTVVGVLPRGFRYPDALADAEAWVVLDPQGPQRTNRALLWLNCVGRLKAGTSVARTTLLLDAFQHRMSGSVDTKVEMAGLRELVVGDVRTSVWVLSAIAGFVLVIACANVANLFLARVLSRHRELTVRRALGAAPWQVLGHFTTETLLLSMGGGLAGVLLAAATIAVFRASIAGRVPMADSIHIATSELLFDLAVSSFVGVLLGLAPFHLVQRSRLADALTEQHASSARYGRLSSAMIAAQIALALVLSIGMGLMGRSLLRLSSVDPGFDPRRLTTFSIGTRTLAENERYEFSRQFLQELSALPYVESASTDSSVPSSPRAGFAPVSADGGATPEGERLMTCFHQVGADYFRTLRIPIRKGRDFSSAELAGKQRVVVISEGLAGVLWPNRDPLGATLTFMGRPHRVIGVSGNLIQGNVRLQKPHHLFLPFDAAFVRPEVTVVVRTDADSSPVVNSARAILKGYGRALPLYGETSFASQMNGSIDQERFTTAFLAIWTTIALLLVVIGIHGVVSYTANQRAHEIGIRMALGARKADILTMTLRQGLWLSAAGAAVGIVGAFAVTRFLSKSLYGVSATDPWTFAVVTFLVAAVSLLACYGPARRAAGIEPMQALRRRLS